LKSSGKVLVTVTLQLVKIFAARAGKQVKVAVFRGHVDQRCKFNSVSVKPVDISVGKAASTFVLVNLDENKPRVSRFPM
jgi:hypothetical protein